MTDPITPTTPADVLRESWRQATLRVATLQRQVQEERKVAQAYLAQIAEQDWNVRPGSVVMFRGAEHLVAAVEPREPYLFASDLEAGRCSMPRPWRKPWLRVRPRRKSGEWSRQEIHAFDYWELVPTDPLLAPEEP